MPMIVSSLLCRLALLISLLAAASASADPLPDLAAGLGQGFEVTTLDGRRLPLRQLISTGKPTVVEFWASWCGPCRKTLPALAELDKRFRNQGLQVVALTVENPKSDGDRVRRFLDELHAEPAIAFASADAFKFMTGRPHISLPKIIFYDADGKVVDFVTGYSLTSTARLERAVEQQLAGGQGE